ncbi:MAG: DUF6528 family protein [Eubacteriales bacterium]
MKTYRLITVLLLSALLLSSCTGGGTETGPSGTTSTPSDTTQVADETTDATFPEPTLGGIPISEYTVVTPEAADNDEVYASKLICDAVRAHTGKKLKTAKTADGRAILIGKTAQTPEQYTAKDIYAVGMSGENVILCGGGGLTVRAARVFLELLFPNGECADIELDEARSIEFERVSLPELTDFGTKPIALADQKNASIAVYDIASGTPEMKYEFIPTMDKGFSLAGYGNRVDEARLRYSAEWGTYVICFTSSSGYAAVASYPEGRRLWQTTLGSASPHTIEYISGGYIAVACSGGSDIEKGYIRLYNAETNKYAYAKLTSAHALLWDETRELLWAMGNNEIVAYEIGGTPKAPTLTKVSAYGSSQMKGGHDLSAVSGDDNLLWVGGSFVKMFDRSTGKLIDTYPGSSQISRSSVKCICSFPDGTAVLTVATGVYAAHDTDRFTLYTFTQSSAVPTEFVFDGRAFYKARAFIAPYN